MSKTQVKKITIYRGKDLTIITFIRFNENKWLNSFLRITQMNHENGLKNQESRFLVVVVVFYLFLIS